MSNQGELVILLERVEQMLNALEVRGEDYSKFQSVVQPYKTYEEKSFVFDNAVQIDEKNRARILNILKRLSKLEERAKFSSEIPAHLQKYIANLVIEIHNISHKAKCFMNLRSMKNLSYYPKTRR